ncbi:serine/threonine-protein kinase [Streptomyces sp. H51]|uniref:serine/threonine-protein kinase n=1 Tax=Streptomyces sp. H51 TaxID=3111770 RepID=UPI002D773513|nr:serine/threonine-protein kinase [Streptomyces sp. H51]
MSEGGERVRDGRLIGGRYRLAERIGSGGMGTVWRAYDELVQREVAVKEPRLPGDPEDDEHRRAAHRLYREARAAARVDHPSAVAIHDVVAEEEDGLPWIVMELVRGESLQQRLARGPVEAREAARIGLAVLGALRAAHAVGIVHRDVKPANVLLGPRGRVVLTDFGIAHVQGEESLTVSGEFVGSLEFVAPERMSGRGAGPASDLWSLGVLLYAAVEGRSPFRRTTPESTLSAVLAADPPEPKQAGPLGPLITRLLAKEAERRPGPEETGAVLETVAEGRPVPVIEEAEAQEGDALVEFGDDQGTVRLAPAPGDPAAGASSAPAARASTAPSSVNPATGAPATGSPATVTPAHTVGSAPDSAPTATETTAPPTRSLLRHPAPMALLGALLVGAAWFGVSLLGDSHSDAVTGHTATYRSAPAAAEASAPGETPTPATGGWAGHREEGMDAVLYLPSAYRATARDGGGSGSPRTVVYAAGGAIQVRLAQWDEAPASPKDQAEEAHAVWDSRYRDARTRYTSTTFRGDEAVLVDTTYGLAHTPTRVMELIVRTGDDRMYRLRVTMPKGTAAEQDGTALFKGARDRLAIRNG